MQKCPLMKEARMSEEAPQHHWFRSRRKAPKLVKAGLVAAMLGVSPEAASANPYQTANIPETYGQHDQIPQRAESRQLAMLFLSAIRKKNPLEEARKGVAQMSLEQELTLAKTPRGVLLHMPKDLMLRGIAASFPGGQSAVDAMTQKEKDEAAAYEIKVMVGMYDIIMKEQK
jgi:hypothetical protein